MMTGNIIPADGIYPGIQGGWEYAFLAPVVGTNINHSFIGETKKVGIRGMGVKVTITVKGGISHCSLDD